MKQYQDMLKHVLENGQERKDRTGTGTIGVFGYQNRYDLQEGFPLMTTKKTSFRIIAEELLWFLKGSVELRDLLDVNVNIWNDDAYRWHLTNNPESSMTKERFLEVVKQGESDTYGLGDLGPIYGFQWRSWTNGDIDENGNYTEDVIDQIDNVIKSIKEDPYGRRHIISAWNAADVPDMALPPCHLLFQFYVSNDNKLSCQLYQRSADIFLGVPFNIASYALLIHVIAHLTDLEVGEFIHTFGDLHAYANHVKQIETQLSREPKELPKLEIARNVESINDFTLEDFSLSGYDPHPVIKGKVSVGL